MRSKRPDLLSALCVGAGVLVALACESDPAPRGQGDTGGSLATNQGFIFFPMNPIDCGAQAGNLAALRARGVELVTDCP